jgi:hypothetical protein
MVNSSSLIVFAVVVALLLEFSGGSGFSHWLNAAAQENKKSADCKHEQQGNRPLKTEIENEHDDDWKDEIASREAMVLRP